MSLGATITGVRDTVIREPEDVEPGSDYWQEYKLDAIEALESMEKWRAFTYKWRLWLDHVPDMAPRKLEEWRGYMYGLRKLGFMPPDAEFRRFVLPQIFASVNLVRMYSRRKDTDPVPPWGATFIVLAEGGFIKRDERGVFIDTAALSDTVPAESVTERPLILDWLEAAPPPPRPGRC